MSESGKPTPKEVGVVVLEAPRTEKSSGGLLERFRKLAGRTQSPDQSVEGHQWRNPFGKRESSEDYPKVDDALLKQRLEALNREAERRKNPSPEEQQFRMQQLSEIVAKGTNPVVLRGLLQVAQRDGITIDKLLEYASQHNLSPHIMEVLKSMQQGSEVRTTSEARAPRERVVRREAYDINVNSREMYTHHQDGTREISVVSDQVVEALKMLGSTYETPEGYQIERGTGGTFKDLLFNRSTGEVLLIMRKGRGEHRKNFLAQHDFYKKYSGEIEDFVVPMTSEIIINGEVSGMAFENWGQDLGDYLEKGGTLASEELEEFIGAYQAFLSKHQIAHGDFAKFLYKGDALSEVVRLTGNSGNIRVALERDPVTGKVKRKLKFTDFDGVGQAIQYGTSEDRGIRIPNIHRFKKKGYDQEANPEYYSALAGEITRTRNYLYQLAQVPIPK